jgi:bilin biosynthesis protein
MSNNRFSNIHLGLSQAEAIRILGSPIKQLDSNSDYYMAAAHLLNFPGLESESALLKLLASTDNSQPIKLAQRKAVEVLGLLGCQDCLPLLFDFLSSDDPYLVENTAWALKQLNCQDKATISRLIELLYLPGQNYRIIIQALSGLGALDSVEAIRCH